MRSLAMAMEIVDAVDRSNVGLVVDAFNLYLHDQWRDLTTLRQIPVEKIFVYHIDDAEMAASEVFAIGAEKTRPFLTA